MTVYVVLMNQEVCGVYTTKEPAGLYTFFFDRASREWVDDAGSNRRFLVNRQNYFNELLSNRGYVFLSEVLQELDIPITDASQSVGWYYDLYNTDAEGGNYIDFGIKELVNGHEPVALLNFNCAGNIISHVKYGFPF